MDPLETDFCVVGAGFAGLIAALRLSQAGHGVVVLEARDRVGGRVFTQQLQDGAWVDRGGAWLGPGQDRVYALAAEMGVGTYRTYNEGESIYMARGTPHRYEGLVPTRMGLFALATTALTFRLLNRASKRVPLGEPWTAHKAAKWDAHSVESRLGSRLRVPSRKARSALEIVIHDAFTAELSEVSLLHLMFLIASHGSMERLTSIEGGNQQDRVIGGAQTIANRVSEQLGEVVQLREPVHRVAQRDGRVEVYGDRLTVNARRAILSLPPTLAARIEFHPLLPNDRALLLQRMPAGPLFKIALVYPDAWWRDDGLTGQSIALETPVGLTLDACGESPPPGILNAFIGGPHGVSMGRLSPEERRKAVVDELVGRFGPKAAAFEEYHEQDWAAEEWTRGCSMAHFPPGVLTQFGPILREPSGRLHWATTETADVTHGGIDGAVRAGERVAAEVIAAERLG